MGTLTMTLPQMIDLAINCPDSGSVNFILLHSALQVLIQQLELFNCNVEFRGKDFERVKGLFDQAKPSQSVNLTEYVVSPASAAGKQLARGRGKKKDDKTINIDDIPESENLQTVVVVETDATKGIEASFFLDSKFAQLQAHIDQVDKQVKELVDMPGNQTLITAIKQGNDGKAGAPVVDLFQTLNLGKRIEAAEVGMEKLASMMEDMVKSNPNITITSEGGDSMNDKLLNLDNRVFNVEQALTTGGFDLPDPAIIMKDPVSGAAPVPGAAPGTAPGSAVTSTAGSTAAPAPGARPQRPSVNKPSDQKAPGDLQPPSVEVPTFAGMTLEELQKSINNELKSIKKDIKAIYDNLGPMSSVLAQVTPEEIIRTVKKCNKKKAGSTSQGTHGGGPVPVRPKTSDRSGAFTPGGGPAGQPPGANAGAYPPGYEGAHSEAGAESTLTDNLDNDDDLDRDDRLAELENLFQNIHQQITSLDSTFNNEFQNLQTQFAEMEKEFGNLMEKIHLGLPGGDTQIAGETVGELYEKILGIQTDMESLADTATKLMEDKEQKERLMDMLMEQIDMLKTIKADKEDLEDALADKADACAINRKVSHDQFDTACDELSKGIEEALSKLTQQEQLWQQALDEIQREIGNKLDRMELGPLRDFINQKLKILQQRLKALMALKQETEAAGTKKFLKNVQCISCDKDVVMRKELDPSVLPQPYALPPTRSMGPYLAYELDALRKQQKSLPTSRNLNHFENAMSSKSPRGGDDHICNRYCGGSHTITTPQQRVTRLGHFLNQWGPEAQPVCDGTKDDEPLVVSGHGSKQMESATTSPKDSKMAKPGGGDAVSTKDSKEPMKKPSPIKEKTSVEKKPSKTSGGSKQSVGSKGVRTSLGSPKVSQSNVKRASQTSAKSAGSQPRSASKLSNKIPEESPSEVAEAVVDEGPPPSEAGAPEVEVAEVAESAEPALEVIEEAPAEAPMDMPPEEQVEPAGEPEA